MDSDFRFRIDASVREKAERICERNGTNLHEVLRSLTTAIARDGRLPATSAVTPPADMPLPFSTYDASLWSDILPIVEGELAIELLQRDVAQTFDRPSPDSDQAARSLRARLIDLLARLSVEDRESVRQALRDASERASSTTGHPAT